MKNLKKLLGWSLLLGMFLGNLATIIGLIWPVTAVTKVSPWLKGAHAYKYDQDGIILTHFIHYNSLSAQRVILFFVLAKATFQYSFNLFLISWVFFGYALIDWFMLWWDFKSGYFMYLILNLAIIIGVVIICRKEKQTAIVKSLE